MKPLRILEIMSRKHALEIFQGPLPPQRSAGKDDCLSEARVSSLQQSEGAQGRKMSSVWREHDFQRFLYNDMEPCARLFFFPPLFP
ncbi:MAG: hypothetical protein D4R56_01450 [Deltaproteobacteria bacterium]|nr:MAG: hypothetical protein D4R56_01450 [Deltaproteobacteria bacterium]